MTIRPATEADVPRMIEVFRRSFLSAFGFSAPFALLQQWIRDDRESVMYPEHWAEMFVLEQDGAIAGLTQPTIDEIDGLWIHPGYQGRGIGSRLLKHGEGVIRERGYTRSWLTCSSYNQRAVGFYRARGYAVIRSKWTQHEGGIEEESFVMERMLDGSPA